VETKRENRGTETEEEEVALAEEAEEEEQRGTEGGRSS